MPDPTPDQVTAGRHETPVTASVVIRMTPLWREGHKPPAGFVGDLQTYAEGLARYIATPLSQFADARGGDCFIAVVLQQGDLTAGIEYRDGEFVKPEPGPTAQQIIEAQDE